VLLLILLFLLAAVRIHKRQIQFLAILLAQPILTCADGFGAFRTEVVVPLAPLLAAKDGIRERSHDGKGNDGGLQRGRTGKFGQIGVDRGHSRRTAFVFEV